MSLCDGSYAAGAAEVKGVIDGKGIMSVQRSAFLRKCAFIYVSKIMGAGLIVSEANTNAAEHHDSWLRDVAEVVVMTVEQVGAFGP